MTSGYLYGEVAAEQIPLSVKEVEKRLQAKEGQALALDKYKDALLGATRAKYAGVRVSVSFPCVDMIDFGFATVKSHSLYQNLFGCDEVFFLAVTLGNGVDRLLLKQSRISVWEHFVTDALASALCEGACELAALEVSRGCACRPRFSPGYGDLPLSFQETLLSAVNAGRLLNITLSNTLLMSPAKSITAIMGIEK